MKTSIKFIFLLIAACLANTAYPVSHYYDAAGRLIQIAYPEGSGITYVYDDNDNLLSTTTVPIPTPPRNLITSSDEDTGVILNWEASDGSEDYRIYRRRGANLAWQEISTVPSGTIAFIDTDTAPNTEYVYRIVAAGSLGLSA